MALLKAHELTPPQISSPGLWPAVGKKPALWTFGFQSGKAQWWIGPENGLEALETIY